MATCGVGGVCFVKNDAAGASFEGSVTVASLSISSGELTTLTTLDLTGDAALSPGAGVTRFFNVSLAEVSPQDHMLVATCSSTAQPHGIPLSGLGLRVPHAGALISLNEILLAPPSALDLPATTVTSTVSSTPNAEGSVDVTLATAATALFVTLTTAAQGRFSDNAFALRPGTSTIQFVPWGALDLELLKSTLRVEHLQVMVAPSPCLQPSGGPGVGP